jgi:hypothetical protein
MEGEMRRYWNKVNDEWVYEIEETNGVRELDAHETVNLFLFCAEVGRQGSMEKESCVA